MSTTKTKEGLDNAVMNVYNAYICMKCIVGTRVDEMTGEMIKRLAKEDQSSESVIVRKCIMRYLPTLEREILGERFVEAEKQEVGS